MDLCAWVNLVDRGMDTDVLVISASYAVDGLFESFGEL